jgi:hypothetical protein
MPRQKPDEVCEKLNKVDVGEMLEVEFGSIATMKCRVAHASDETEIHHRELILQSKEGQSIIVELELIQQTRPNEINHFKNKAYIVSKAGRNRFGKVTKALIK